MTSSGVRRVLLACGGATLTAVLAACSGGSSSHVSVGPTTTVAAHSTSTTTMSAAATKKRAAATPKKLRPAAKVAAKSSRGSAQQSTTGSASRSQSQLSISVTPTTGGTSSYTWQIVDDPTTPRTTPPTTVPGPKPYDPTKPIDLSGTPGVTPAEQARAEQLVRDTLRDLPRYATTAAAYADGYRSIQDGFTGTEHYVKWSLVDDGRILDSKYPESLVYQYRNGVQTLVSAMYMLWTGARFSDAPDVGGALTQWHIHGNLCLVDNPSDPLQKIVGLQNRDGSCPAGSTKATSMPMLHVWIVANPCGPFAPLEGVSAGQVPDGQTPLCDTAHGSR